ncbi:MAG: hypothetical protein EOP83_01860 [Verrucomicrobiaceae bacterium]|nr:MAG: hypothetical protein EOP83_01860 [Verrucomicrobiaceae bacterium]
MRNPLYNGWVPPGPDHILAFKPGPYSAVAVEGMRYFPWLIRFPDLGLPWSQAIQMREWGTERFGESALITVDRRGLPIYYSMDLRRVLVALTGDYLFMQEEHAFEFKMRWV